MGCTIARECSAATEALLERRLCKSSLFVAAASERAASASFWFDPCADALSDLIVPRARLHGTPCCLASTACNEIELQL